MGNEEPDEGADPDSHMIPFGRIPLSYNPQPSWEKPRDHVPASLLASDIN